MKYAVLVCRILLGLLFLIFGANNILHFMHMDSPTGDAGVYSALLADHGVMKFVGFLMVVSGLLLLVGRFVPLALTILGPILVNILIFHFLIAHGGAAAGLVATVLWLVVLFGYRANFLPLFAPDPKPITP